MVAAKRCGDRLASKGPRTAIVPQNNPARVSSSRIAIRFTAGIRAGLVVFLFAAMAGRSEAQSVYWNMQTAGPTSNTVGNLVVGNLIQGNNSGTTTMLGSTSASSGYTFTLSGSTTSASGSNNAGAAARTGSLNTGSSAFFEFTLTPASGYGFNFSSIGFGSRSTSTGPKAFTLRSSLDSYASDLLTPGVLNSTSTWAYSTGTLTSGTSGTSAVTYRLFGYSGTGVASVNTANWRIDDLVLSLNSFSTGGSTDLYYDGVAGWNGTAPGSGGSGSWADGTGSWDSAKTANFGGVAGTVTAGDVTAGRGMVFSTSGYTVTGGTVTLTAASIGFNTISTGTSTPFAATINSVLAGTAGMTKIGAGTLSLGGANTFSGDVAISDGVLEITADAALGASANDVSLASSSATLKTTASVVVGAGRDLTGAGTIDIAAGTTLTAQGGFSMSATTLANSGTLDLQGVTRSVGVLTFTSGATVTGAGPISATGLSATGLTSGTATVNSAISFSNNDKTVDVGAGGTLVLNGDVSGSSVRIGKTGAGTLIASGANATNGFRLGFTGTTPTDGGLLVLAAAAASGTSQLWLNFGTLQTTAPFTFANGVSIGGRSNGVAVIGGTNAIAFSGSSNFSRGFQTSGELRLDVNNTTTLGRLGATTGSGSSTGVTLGGTGRLILAGDGTGFAEPVTVGAGLTLELANATSLASATLVTTTGSIAYGVASTAVGGLSGSGNLALPTSTLTVGGNGASTTYSGQFSGAGSLVKTGTGTLTLSGNNGHSGGTTLSAGSLVAGDVNAFGTGTVTVGGGSLDLGGLAVANALATTGGAITGATAYAGTIGVGGLTAFTGTVGGTVNVASSGTLAGNGSAFTGPVLIGAGGVHAPGSSPGSQFFSSGLAYDPTAALSWELWGNTASAGAAGTLYDTIAVTSGSLSIGSGALINLIFSGSGSTVDWSDPFWTTDQSWTVISATAASASTGVFTLGTIGTDQQGDQLTTVLPNASFNVSRTAGGDIVLNFIAVPEPSTLALAGLGLAALAGLAVRRRRSHRF